MKSKYFAMGLRTRSMAKQEAETFLADVEKVKKETVDKPNGVKAKRSKSKAGPAKKVRRVEVKIDPEDLAVEPKKDVKKKTTTKKKVKKERMSRDDNIPSAPPANFWPMYNEIKKMRAKITTPVDKMGCSKISTEVSGLTEGPVWRFQVLISLMLSSQTKDETNLAVMEGMEKYFVDAGYKDGLCLQAILDVDQKKLDDLIFKVGFHHRKADYIKRTAVILKEKHNSDIPRTIEEITAFPGVGPKMGFLLLQIAYNIHTGIGVDTHMARMAGWFHWVPTKGGNKPDPEFVRKCLEKMLADHREEWGVINEVLVGFGQVVCLPQNPRCDVCTLSRTGLCPAVDKRLLRQVEMNKQRGVSSPQKKSRGDLSKLME